MARARTLYASLARHKDYDQGGWGTRPLIHFIIHDATGLFNADGHDMAYNARKVEERDLRVRTNSSFINMACGTVETCPIFEREIHVSFQSEGEGKFLLVREGSSRRMLVHNKRELVEMLPKFFGIDLDVPPESSV